MGSFTGCIGTANSKRKSGKLQNFPLIENRLERENNKIHFHWISNESGSYRV